MSYLIGHYCVEEDYYRSDEEYIKRILTSKWPYTLVVGLRRMGKTSFLRRLERAANQEALFNLKNENVTIEFSKDFLPVYFSFHETIAEWRNKAREIIEVEFDNLEATISSTDDEFVFWLEACRQKACQDNKTLFVLLDECEELFSDKHRLRALSEYFQEEFNPDNPQLYVVLAASPSIFQLKDNRYRYEIEGATKTIPIFEKTYGLFETQTFSIMPLSKEEASALICQSKDETPIRKRGGRVVNDIIEYAGSHPLVLQAVSMECLVTRGRHERLIFNGNEDFFQKAYGRLKKQYCDSFFRTGLTDTQRAILISVHRQDIVAESDCHPKYRLVLDELIKHGAFIKEDDELRVENQFLDTWLERDNTAKTWADKNDELVTSVKERINVEMDSEWIDYNPNLLPEPIPTEQRFVIHHLSDIHVGGSFSLLDNKDWRCSTLAELLECSAIKEYLNYLDDNVAECPHVLIVSGDLGTTGQRSELLKAVKFIKEEICETRMQPLEGLHWNRRVIIVPGNHDIQWPTSPSRKVGKDKFRNFKVETEGFITPFAMPIPDGTYIPFLLIPNIPLLVYGFNSSVGGGEFLPWLEEIRNEFRNTVVAKMLDTKELRSKLMELARMDAAFIDETDLNIFRGWGRKWRQNPKSYYDEYVKIAVCHHHLSHFPITEIRKFESVINAGRIKQTLIDCDFDIVLHGHKHLARGFYEELLENCRKGLYIISSGTLGSCPAEGFPAFNQIEINYCGGKYGYECEVFVVRLEGGKYIKSKHPSYKFSRQRY